MSSDVFGRRLDTNVHALFKCAAEEGVAQVLSSSPATVGLRRGGDRRNVRHLERLRAWASTITRGFSA